MVLGIDWILSPNKHVDPCFSRAHFDDLVSQCHDIHRPLPKLLRSLPTSIVLPPKHRLGHSLGEQVTVYLETHSSFRTCLLNVSMFMMELSLASKSFYGRYSVEHFILI